MIVYVEYVLFENMIIDGLILFLVSKTLKNKTNWWGIVVASFLGAIFALISAKINGFSFLSILTKLVYCFFMAYFLDFSLKKIFKKFFLIFVYTFLFGGFVLFAFKFFGVSTQSALSLQYNLNFPVVGMIGLIVIFAMMVCYHIKKVLAKKKISSFLYDIKLLINNKTKTLCGFLDTGNTLKNKDGKPVLMISEKALERFFSPHQKLLFLLQKYQNLKLPNMQTISVSSISGKTNILVFDAEKCVVGKSEIDVCVGVFGESIFKNKNFDVILSPKMLEVMWNV